MSNNDSNIVIYLKNLLGDMIIQLMKLNHY